MRTEPSKQLLPFAFFILVLCISAGVASGVSFFLFLLIGATNFFTQHWTVLIVGLPIWGLALYWLQTHRSLKALATSESILEEIQNPRLKISALLAPFIIITTVLSHLFGAAVGRESAAIQIGASISETVSEFFKKIFHLPENRSLILRLGLAAGFSAAFGTPLTGALFSLEHPQHLNISSLKSSLWILMASYGSYFFASIWGPAHTHWPQINFLWSSIDLLEWLSFSLALALFCLVYEWSLLFVQALGKDLKWGMKIFFGGLLILLATYIIGGPTYNGLGTNLTEQALNQDSTWTQVLSKMLFLILSVGSGFKGGEVTPLISIAALFAGAYTTSFIYVSAGLSAIFAYRLRAPIAGVLILVELFNWKVAVISLGPILCCWLLNELLRAFGRRLNLQIFSTVRRYY